MDNSEMKNNDMIQAQIYKLNFLAEIIDDWTVDPGDQIIETWSDETRINVFAGISQTLQDTANALQMVYENLENKRVQALRNG